MPSAGIYWIILLPVLARVGCESWSEEACNAKIDECSDMQSGSGECSRYNQTINCFTVYLDNCIAESLFANHARNMTIKDDYCPTCSELPLETCINSFFTPPTPTPSTTVTSQPPDCPLFSLLLPPHSDLGSPSLSHPPPSPECSLPPHETYYKQHCSIFSLSHLRPFGDRNLPLQTCILYGNIYLIKHENLSVSVRGSVKTGAAGWYTDITEVNVTVHTPGCLSEDFHYRATLAQPLPPPPSSPLSVSVNNSVATISVPGINTTIVIHRTTDFLSVSLQVPEPLTRHNQVTGLCSDGCAPPFIVDTQLRDYSCQSNKESASIMCLALELSMPPQGSVSYTDLCLYDILVTHNVPNLLSLYTALDKDALLLPDVTEIIPTDPTHETTPSSNKPLAEVSSIVIVTPTQPTESEALASRTAPSSHPLIPLTFLPLLLHLITR